MIALCGLQVTAQAATVIYDNRIPATSVSNGRVNDADYPIYLEHADNFALVAAAVVNGITWNGQYKSNDVRPDNFSLRIYAIMSGLPAMSPLVDIALSGVVRQDTGIDIIYSLSVYSYSAEFPDLALGAGNYALSIYNHALDGASWTWSDRDSSANGSFMIMAGDTAWRYYSGGPEFSFVLTQVPEPGVVLTLAVGVPILLRRRRARKIRQACSNNADAHGLSLTNPPIP